MTTGLIYCPLLKKDIRRSLCQKITYAAEGRISHAVVSEVADWIQAKNVCADCVHAYWNQNKMQHDL